MSFFAERIVMTPKKKTSNSTTLKMERKKIVAKSDGSNVHIAGGTNAGIVVNKQQSQDQDDIWANIGPHLCLEFRVFLINTSTKRYTQEKRIISYWFKDLFALNQRATAAQDFFKTLVSPTDFPRDYVGFIKKVMKLMQLQYPMMAKVEVEMTQEKEMDQLPNRPSKFHPFQLLSFLFHLQYALQHILFSQISEGWSTSVSRRKDRIQWKRWANQKAERNINNLFALHNYYTFFACVLT